MKITIKTQAVLNTLLKQTLARKNVLTNVLIWGFYKQERERMNGIRTCWRSDFEPHHGLFLMYVHHRRNLRVWRVGQVGRVPTTF